MYLKYQVNEPVNIVLENLSFIFTFRIVLVHILTGECPEFHDCLNISECVS